MLVYKQTKEWERCPNFFRHLYKTLMPENFGKDCQELPTRKAESKDQASHSRKQQTTRSDSVHWWLSHQRPVRMGLHCQARCDHHPWKQYSLWCLNLQLNNGGGSSLCWFASRGDSQTTHAILLTDSMSLVQKRKSGMGSPDRKLFQKLLWV